MGAIAATCASAGPTRRPRVSAATSVADSVRRVSALTGPARSGGLMQALDDLRREGERVVGGDDAAALGIGVEDERVVPFGPDPLDDRVDAGLQRAQQLRVEIGRASCRERV